MSGEVLINGLLASGGEVANLSALATIQGYRVGRSIYVDTLKCAFISHPANSTIADGYSIVDGYGVQWHRVVGSSDGYWLNQPIWYVDSVAGSDENDGYTSITALKTTDEIQRRWGADPVISTVVIINYINMPRVNSLRCRRLDETCGISIIGIPTIVHSDTVATFSAVNYTTKKWAQITATSVTDWTSYVGLRLNFNDLSYAFIAKANPHSAGIATARIGVPYADGNTRTWGSTFSPNNGSVVTIESLPSCEHLRLEVLGGSYNYPNNTQYTVPSIRMQGIQTTKSTTLITDWGNFSQHIYACDMTDLDSRCAAVGAAHPVACRLIYRDGRIPSMFNGSGLLIVSLAAQVTCLPGTGCEDCIFQDTLFQGASLLLYDGIYATFRGVGFFDIIGDAVGVKDQSFLSNVLNMTGDDITGYGIGVDNAKVMDSGGNILTLSGTSGDWHFNQGSGIGSFLWADIPQNQSGMSGSNALSNGTVIVNAKNIPTDAIIQLTYLSFSGPPGTLSITGLNSSGFTINSTSLTDNATIGWSWQSPSMRHGIVFYR